MKRILSLLLCVIVFVCPLSSCTDDTVVPSPIGTYIYEGEGFGGDFCIEVYENGTFFYSVGYFSSYIGRGNWSMDGDVLCLKDHEYPSMKYVNYFKVKEDKLIFIKKHSTNFMYLKVSNGEEFNKTTSD